jgi:hypothetical protein
MSERKFKVRDAVEYRPPHGIWAPKGTYSVTAELPMVAGEFHYQIKIDVSHTSASRERASWQDTAEQMPPIRHWSASGRSPPPAPRARPDLMRRSRPTTAPFFQR